MPPRRLKSRVLCSAEGGGERRQRGQTGVTWASLREKPFLVASGLLMCKQRDETIGIDFFFFFSECGASGVYLEVRDETLLSLLLRLSAKILLEEEEADILCHIWYFTSE